MAEKKLRKIIAKDVSESIKVDDGSIAAYIKKFFERLFPKK